MEPYKESTRGQRRRTEAKRKKAQNLPKYPIGTILSRELIAKEDMVMSNGAKVKKGQKYIQSYAEMKLPE